MYPSEPKKKPAPKKNDEPDYFQNSNKNNVESPKKSTSIPPEPQPAYKTHSYDPFENESRIHRTKEAAGNTKLIAAAAISVIIFAAFLIFILSIANTAYIGYSVSSNHITESVDVIVYVDGKEVTTYNNLKPGGSFYGTYYYAYHYPIWEHAKIITVKAISTGGGFGTQSDSKDIIVEPGRYYYEYLSV